MPATRERELKKVLDQSAEDSFHLYSELATTALEPPTHQTFEKMKELIFYEN